MTTYLRMPIQAKDRQRRQQQEAGPDWLERQAQAKAAKVNQESRWERIHYVGADGRPLPTYYRRRIAPVQTLEA